MSDGDRRRILVLGGSGMLGHRLVEGLGGEHDVTAAFRDASRWRACPLLQPERVTMLAGLDVRRLDSVVETVAAARPQVIVNAVGIIKQLDAAHDPVQAIEVNALLPHRLAALAREAGARLVHFSTDCVFSGRHGGYTESDIPDPVDLYGRSKLLGEVAGENAVTLRTSIIGRELRNTSGLLEWFLANRGRRVRGYRRVVYSGITTREAARVVSRVVRDGAISGVFNVASEPITKYDLLVKLRDRLRLDIDIEPADEPVCDRSLSSDRFRGRTGYVAPSWDEMAAELSPDIKAYDNWRSEHVVV